MMPQLARRRARPVIGVVSRASAVGLHLLLPLARAVETFVWGGERRERILIGLLRRHYDSVLRRQWKLAGSQPHYFDHRVGSFAFATGTGQPFGFYRGFLAAELVPEGSTLLDIGCGDGFFARRFFAPRCAHVDAIDVDAAAIAHATRRNGAPNISYRLLDAVREPFPRQRYDVIVMDGSLAHFSPTDTSHLLGKIRGAIVDDGVFVGSEALGDEDHDHLRSHSRHSQTSGRRLASISSTFSCVQFGTRYPSGAAREEAYWRCSPQSVRLDQAAWRDYTGRSGGT